MTKAGGNWLQAAFLTTEEEIEEVTANLAASKETGMDVALEAVLSELDDILSLTKNDTDGFSQRKRCFGFTFDRLWQEFRSSFVVCRT